jgi:hypothetical protein
MIAYKSSHLAHQASIALAPFLSGALQHPPALVPASLNFGRGRLNVPCFKRVTCNHRIFIDKKYKRPILDQRVGIKPGGYFPRPVFLLGR